MKKNVLRGFVVLAVLALLAPAIALAGDAAMKSCKGEITAVDASAKTVTVKIEAMGQSEAKEMTLSIDDATKIVKDGQTVDLTALQKGDRVAVNYRHGENGAVAVSIGIQKG